MGTQQILLIVLSVIIVGVAVAVGITMFNAQSINSNRSACIGDMNTFAAAAYAWYKTPVSHGGSGYGTITGGLTIVDIGNWTGFDFDGATKITTANGIYTMSLTGTTDLVIIADGTGNDVVDPQLTLTWDGGGIVTVADTSS